MATATETPVDAPRRITGPPAAGMESFDRLVPRLMDRWDVPGGAVAVVKDGRLVFARGYGLANRSTQAVVTPTARFRIASLAKPLTSAAVLRLVENGRVDLDDRVFDVLDEFRPSGPADPRIDDITVRMLLRHTGGWDIEELGFDPMFESVRIAREEGENPPASAETVIRFMLKRDLNFDPGKKFAYSNFGYCVLGRLVARITGQSYESYVRNSVLSRTEVSRMRIGATRLENRADDEVRYYHDESTDSVFPDEGTVPTPYGGFYLQAMDAHGGWIASPIDLLRFVTHVDGRGPVADVLSSGTVRTMTSRPAAAHWDGSDYYYGMGWLVRPSMDNWWHSGSLPGTSSLMVRTGHDLSWAALFNRRSSDEEFVSALDRTLWEAARSVSTWPDRDLFGAFP
ncbi:serine hydrolase domain-containing protein [Salinigranum marinum]|uniref:serine hydrolase domain-containing protein n=1 Tax=Salinigranum marinum TaxID=1515595 RepID=UPI002989C947|nr:serine hydrolase domain-containing protein [Salinigranum marinum]